MVLRVMISSIPFMEKAKVLGDCAIPIPDLKHHVKAFAGLLKGYFGK